VNPDNEWEERGVPVKNFLLEAADTPISMALSWRRWAN
jgi:hypothetical protein